ncbi:Type II secretion system protein E [compost metagenome]
MVGEIRDSETAEIAIRASLTGHLVLSTLHTNDSVSSITRFRDMGVESYLIASSLIGVVAQRLVRRVCNDCKEPVPPTEQEAVYLRSRGLHADKLQRGRGCGSCNMSGFRGRVAIHEVLVINSELRELINSSASLSELREAAAKQGMIQLMDDGLDKVLQGITTLQEVLRETVAT